MSPASTPQAEHRRAQPEGTSVNLDLPLRRHTDAEAHPHSADPAAGGHHYNLAPERTPSGALPASPPSSSAMSTFEDLTERVERLLLRHEELKRTNALLEQQLAAVVSDRDSLRSRLAAARSRIDALIERLPAQAPADDDTGNSSSSNPPGSAQ